MSHHHRSKDLGITRRRFLQTSGAFAGALLISRALPARAASIADGFPERMGMLTDLSRCIGCRACEAACNRANKLPPPETPFSDTTVFEEVRRPTNAAYTVVNRYAGTNGQPTVYRKVQCMHCNEPACVSVCPAAAMVKTPEGPVLWDERVCIGCRYCMVACPFYVPSYEYSDAFHPRVRKCTMCYERVFKQGGTPACAEACPVGATIFGKRSDLIRTAQQRIVANPGKYVDRIYGEHEVGGTSWLYLSPIPFEEMCFPEAENTAYGEFTWDFLTAVPVVLILWPLFMVGLYKFAQRREQVAVEEALKKAQQSREEQQP